MKAASTAKIMCAYVILELAKADPKVMELACSSPARKRSERRAYETFPFAPESALRRAM